MTQIEKALNQFEYRLCSSSGSYPSQSIYTESAGLHISDELVAISWLANEPDAKSRLLVSLLLATNFKVGFLKLYPFPFIHQVSLPHNQLSIAQLNQEVKAKLKADYVLPGEVLPEFVQYQNAKGASLPLILDGMPYHQVENLVCEPVFEQISQKLNGQELDELFPIAELLMTSAQLNCHFQFQKQAVHYLLMAIKLAYQLSWFKSHPKIEEWSDKLNGMDLELTSSMTPIEYINLYRILVTNLKNSFLDVSSNT